MKILALDTSTMDSAIAIMEDDKILAEIVVNQEKTHSESLVPMTKYLLDSLAYKLEDIDLFAVGIGPGSFTGLRIGMTSAKTFSQVTSKPVIGISTLDALALNSSKDGLILALIDARGGRYYYSLLERRGDKLIKIKEDTLIYFEDIVESLEGYEDISVVGDYREDIKEELKKIRGITFLDETRNGIISRNIAYLAKKKYQVEDLEDFDKLLPNYVRESQAQRDFKGK